MERICRGTTPTISCVLPFDTSELETAYLTAAQGECIVWEKSLQDMTLDGNTITVKLGQEDTLHFRPDTPVQMQLRARLRSGDCIASETVTRSVYAIMKDGVI